MELASSGNNYTILQTVSFDLEQCISRMSQTNLVVAQRAFASHIFRFCHMVIFIFHVVDVIVRRLHSQQKIWVHVVISLHLQYNTWVNSHN